MSSSARMAEDGTLRPLPPPRRMPALYCTEYGTLRSINALENVLAGNEEAAMDHVDALSEKDLEALTAALPSLLAMVTGKRAMFFVGGFAALRDPVGKPGDRLVDGGVPGTLVVCTTCSGDGLLHEPDYMPETVAPQATQETQQAQATEPGEPRKTRWR